MPSGELAILGRRWDDAMSELDQAGDRAADRIPHAHLAVGPLLARAQAAAGKLDAASSTARVTVETIDLVAARAPEPALRQIFNEWARSRPHEELHRILG